MTVPDWLTRHAGRLAPGLQPHVTLVMLGDQPQYRVDVRPAGGTFAAAVTQSVNGKRLDDPAKTYPDPAAALAGGLDQLREKLGW